LLCHLSVIENIAVGDETPSMHQIIDICKQLGISTFIEQLPNGFHTYLGENGTALSGGEKQRIAIARALYLNPEILILDEATPSLDTTAENYIKRTIEILLAKQKTIIVIAHRLSTIKNADEIIVLHQGKVVEQGRHLDLLQQNGHYTQLYQQQYE
jgi:ABC-type multidrug transport system fused ATPase/permease subunit